MVRKKKGMQIVRSVAFCERLRELVQGCWQRLPIQKTKGVCTETYLWVAWKVACCSIPMTGSSRSRNQPKKFFSTRKLKWNVAQICKNLVASRRPLYAIFIESVVHISEGNYIWCPNKNTAKPYGDALVYTLHSLLIDKGCLTTPNFRKSSKRPLTPTPHFRKIMLRISQQKCVCSLWRDCYVLYDPISHEIHVVQQFNMVIGWKTYPEKTLFVSFSCWKSPI